MKRILSKKLWLVAIFVSAIVYLSCTNGNKKPGQTSDADSTSCQCSDSVAIPFGPTIPGDLPNGLFTNQVNANCFGWWEFITLNWPTDGDFFGKPNSTAPVQWETFITSQEVYLPDGIAPRAWKQAKPTINLPDEVLKQDKRMSEATLLLGMTSKFDGLPMFLDSLNTEEAQPQFSPAWLGATNGTNVWYAIHFNEDEYNYIVQNQFYNAYNQHTFVNEGKPIVFPQGQYQGAQGAIEIKSAWLEVTNPENQKWNTYKLSKAVVQDFKTGKFRFSIVALVGLHILQKTASQPQWVWTTFEHEDNAPDVNQTDTTSRSYNFYNPAYQPQTVTVPAGCNNTPGTYTFANIPNQSPPYYLCKGLGPVPIQVKRSFPIDTLAQAANARLHAYIGKKYPGSIWEHYNLVNVLWSFKNPALPKRPQIEPLIPEGMLPDAKTQPVANTTMETYIQNTTCTNCHKFTQIAPIPTNANPRFAADYTFSMFNAKYPKNTLDKKAADKKGDKK